MTRNGICIGDMYILSYYGIKVIFQVCDTGREYAYIYELATKKYKDGYTLTKKYRGSKNPLVVDKKNNVFSRSRYRVKADRADKKISIKIDGETRLYWEAFKYVDDPVPGRYLARPFLNHRDVYWKKPTKRKVEIKEDISA